MLQNFESLVLAWLALGFLTFITLLKIPAPYGKFSKTSWGPMIPSKLGWFVMEIISPLALIYFFLNGTISSLMGIGGGTLSVPYISFLIDDIKKSIATASALGLVIATTSIIFMCMINLEIFYSKINHLSLLLIIPASIVGSYIGVTLLKKIDADKVKKIFSGLLIIIALYIFID